MSNTFIKKSLRGFTLIELLVVIAIIGLLSTAIMGPVQTGLKKGRDTRKISDLTQVQGALLQYAGDNNGAYATSLPSLSPTYMAVDNKMLSTAAARDKFMYITYADGANIIVLYHLGAALENQNASLQGDADCGNVTAGGASLLSGAALGGNSLCGSGLTGAATNTNYAANGAGNPAAGSAFGGANVDFGGAGSQEDLNEVCSATLSTCIFDIIPN